jgi:gamma-glutamylcysteine synthetase
VEEVSNQWLNLKGTLYAPSLMSLDVQQTQQQPIGNVEDLVQLLVAAGRKDGPLLLGLEHERLLFPKNGSGPVAYDGRSDARGFSRFRFH